MKCTKMHGCGNDFVVIRENECRNKDMQELAAVLCDRHFGIGADGLIVVKENPLEFMYWNSDGSYSPFCGNGIRCFAKYCVMKQLVRDHKFEVVCSKWIVTCCVENEMVTVDIPEICEKENGQVYVCGSCHRVIENEKLDETRIKQSDEYNVNLLRIVDDSTIEIKTLERGAGLTLACGSGSVAAAWHMLKNYNIEEKIVVKNPGGNVEVDIKKKKMRGPAEFVFECECNENALNKGKRERKRSQKRGEKKE